MEFNLIEILSIFPGIDLMNLLIEIISPDGLWRLTYSLPVDVVRIIADPSRSIWRDRWVWGFNANAEQIEAHLISVEENISLG